MRTIIVAVVGLVLAFGASAQNAGNPLGDDPPKFDQQMEAAALRQDVAFFQTVLSDDVRFTHGTGLVQDKTKWLASAGKSKYFLRDLDSVEVESHGDVVETTGHVHVKSGNARNPEYHIWYVRVYAKRDGRWQLLSNRTVREVDGAMPAK